ncbi:hypothetical protein GQ53DRAFT_702512, partial [Thozetella sp. PMI_491]
MLSLRLARAAPLRGALPTKAPIARLPIVQRRSFIPDAMTGRTLIEEKYPTDAELTAAEDPDMNGGYINPPRVKRQHRDPHADWWDKQERRNFGEPVHEDHDVLGMFSPYEYTWTTPGKGLFQIGLFIATFTGVCFTVKAFYPDIPSYPREFEDGLERELGGAGAIRDHPPEVNKHGELEGLRFPHFREELLYQNHWNPGDDIGRIKIIISEGFPRDSLSVPLERVKNIIAFSFQHAPLDILENNGIAWPNPYMWRRAVPNLPMAAPTGRSNDGSEAHAHTPRRR